MKAPKGAPKWLKDTDGEEYDSNDMIVVAVDGSGNFNTITEAINFVPNNSMDRFVIYIKEGIYEENVEIPSYKSDIVMLGDGSDVIVITGNRSVADGWTTFRSATLDKTNRNRYNKLEEKKESKILKFLGFMWNPLSWVMEAAVIMAIAMAHGGDKPWDYQDFVGIIILLVINSTISFIEENNAGNAAAVIMARLAPKAKVPRDGNWSEEDASVLE